MRCTSEVFARSAPARQAVADVGGARQEGLVATHMRAVVLRGGRLEVRETADPIPGPGELLLRTVSTAICASDVHFMDHPEAVVNDGTGRFVYDEHRDMVLGH